VYVQSKDAQKKKSVSIQRDFFLIPMNFIGLKNHTLEESFNQYVDCFASISSKS
jgi:hypothetical protein